MDGSRAEMLAARNHLQTHGWISRHSEAFRHLPPPALERWLDEAGSRAACDASPLAGAGWTVHPVGDTPASGFDARWLDALDAMQRAELFAGLPSPGDGEAAPFAWAHRALCRHGLRLRIKSASGRAEDLRVPAWIEARHQPRAQVEAPMLVLDVEDGAHCILIESHERDASLCAQGIVQNLHARIRLGRGATLQHLRIVTPEQQDDVAHHLDVTLQEGARYAQALVATGSAYHLQRGVVRLQGSGAEARNTGLLLTGGHAIDQQIYSNLNAARTRSQVEVLALATDSARAVANAYTRIAAGSDDADVHQRLAGVVLAGNPRVTLRPHLEILHDQVQAVHGATWGALPEDALFYARQRGLDEASARALIIEGMAHAVLERCLGSTDEQPDRPGLLTQWLDGGRLKRIIARQLASVGAAVHG